MKIIVCIVYGTYIQIEETYSSHCSFVALLIDTLHASFRNKEWIAANDVDPTLSVLPVHSTATDACFRNREEMDDVVGKHREAAMTFQNYVRSFAKGVVIPGAFGWRVSTPAQSNDPDCEWMNRRIFPLTPAEGFDIAVGMGVETHVWSPGDEVEVGGSRRCRVG